MSTQSRSGKVRRQCGSTPCPTQERCAAGTLALGTSFTYRLRPAVLNVPAPNQDGRDVNLIKDALSWSLTARLGIGNRLELTALAAGLSQRGAGIKGVTSQAAPAIDSPALQDPRVGFGYSLNTSGRHLGVKLRFEAKLPLGNAEAFAGERSFVASPSIALSTKLGGRFGGVELGARLRRPSNLFGLRVGSQALLAAGGGYQLARPRLSFALELYVLPSLIDSGSYGYLPAEWLLTTRFAPRCSATSRSAWAVAADSAQLQLGRRAVGLWPAQLPRAVVRCASARPPTEHLEHSFVHEDAVARLQRNIGGTPFHDAPIEITTVREPPATRRVKFTRSSWRCQLARPPGISPESTSAPALYGNVPGLATCPMIVTRRLLYSLTCTTTLGSLKDALVDQQLANEPRYLLRLETSHLHGVQVRKIDAAVRSDLVLARQLFLADDFHRRTSHQGRPSISRSAAVS